MPIALHRYLAVLWCLPFCYNGRVPTQLSMLAYRVCCPVQFSALSIVSPAYAYGPIRRLMSLPVAIPLLVHCASCGCPLRAFLLDHCSACGCPLRPVYLNTVAVVAAHCAPYSFHPRPSILHVRAKHPSPAAQSSSGRSPVIFIGDRMWRRASGRARSVKPAVVRWRASRRWFGLYRRRRRSAGGNRLGPPTRRFMAYYG